MGMGIFLFRCLSRIALLATTAAAVASAHGILLGVMTNVPAPNEQRPQLNLARKIGFDSVRCEFPWQRVETTKGVYKIPAAWDALVNEARRRSIEPLVILDYGNKFYDDGNKPSSKQAIRGFVHYATFVVKHFAGRVRYFEIWNEWDVDGFPPGHSRIYARLFDAVYPAVKKVDPTAVFLASASAGGDNGWYEKIARLGVAARADGVAVHPYVYPRKPNTGSSLGSDEAERSVKQVTSIEKTMRRLSGDKQIPLYITEIGWPTNIGRLGLAPQGVAFQARRALLMYSALPYVRGVWWYDLRDHCNRSDYKRCFGLANYDLSLKPAAYAIASIAPVIKHNDYVMSTETNLNAGLVVLSELTPSAHQVIAWHVRPSSAGNRATSDGRYVISCSSQLKVIRSARDGSASDFAIGAVPTLFTYRSDHCARQVLSSSKPFQAH